MKPSLFLGHEWLHNIHICLWQLWNILSVTYLIHFSFQCGIFYFRIFRNCIYLQRISLIFYSKKVSREETDVFRIRHSFKICFYGKLIRINQFIIYEKKIIYLGKKNDHAGYLLKYEIHCTCITIATIVLIQSKQSN